MPTRIAGVVLRASDRHATASFYARLGLTTREHEHGGPKHYEIGPSSEGFVVEAYAKSAAFPRDAVMVEVDSIEAALEALVEFGTRTRTALKVAGDMKFVYVSDPDGRDVMLIEQDRGSRDRSTSGAP
jgi:hypothetical protein